MELLIQLLGRPTIEDVYSLASEDAERVISMLTIPKTKSFKHFVSIMGEQGVDLLKKMLVYNPHKRITVDEALSHPYLREFTEREGPIECCPTIHLPIDDNQRLTAEQYMKALYQEYCSKDGLENLQIPNSRVMDLKIPGAIISHQSIDRESWHDHSDSTNHGMDAEKAKKSKAYCNFASGSGVTAAGTAIGSASTCQPTHKQSGHSATPSNILSQPSSIPRNQLNQEGNNSTCNQHNSSQLTLSPVNKSIVQNTHLRAPNSAPKQAVLLNQSPLSPSTQTSPQFQAKIQSILQSTILGRSTYLQTGTGGCESFQQVSSLGERTHSPPLSPANQNPKLPSQFLHYGLLGTNSQISGSPTGLHAPQKSHHIANSISLFDEASINMHCQSQITTTSNKKSLLSKKRSIDMMNLPKSKSKEKILKKKKSIDFVNFGGLCPLPNQDGVLDFAKKRLTATLIQVPQNKSPLPNKKVVPNAGANSGSRLRPSKNRTALLQANTSLNRRQSIAMITEEKQASFSKQLKKKLSARSISPSPPHADPSLKTLAHSRSAKAFEPAVLHQSVLTNHKQTGSSSQLLNSSNSAQRRLYSPTAKELLQNMIALEQTENFFKQFEPLKRKAKPLEKSATSSQAHKTGNQAHSTSTIAHGGAKSKGSHANTESVRSGLKRSGSPGFNAAQVQPSPHNTLGLQALTNLSQMKSSTRNLLNNQHLLGKW